MFDWAREILQWAPFLAAGFIGSFFSGQRKADDSRRAAKEYINYLKSQRDTFLNQSESQAIRKRLGEWATGNVGYSQDTLDAMNKGTVEDYGRGLRDFKRNVAMTGGDAGGRVFAGSSCTVRAVVGGKSCYETG